MLNFSVIKGFTKPLHHSKIQTYRMIHCTVIGHQNAKNGQIFGAETKSKLDKV